MKYKLLFYSIIYLQLISCSGENARKYYIDSLGLRELEIGSGDWFKVISDNRLSMDSLFIRMAKQMDDIYKNDRDVTQLAIKQLIRQDYLHLHPEYLYVTWMEIDNSNILNSWWESNRSNYYNSKYELPPCLNAVNK